MIEVKTICPKPVIKEIFPTSFITLGERFNPTRNNKKETPMLDIVEKNIVSLRRFKNNGPVIIPDKI
jgi:hypothetical protein